MNERLREKFAAWIEAQRWTDGPDEELERCFNAAYRLALDDAIEACREVAFVADDDIDRCVAAIERLKP
jgi:hypothetical protein